MSRSVLLPCDVDAVMRAHVRAHYPFEACGLLLGERESNVVRITRAVPCANVAKQSHRGHFFVIDPREMTEATRSVPRTGGMVVGFFHSHPSAAAVPSTADVDRLRIWAGTVWLILSVAGGTAATPRAWSLDSPHHDAADELPVRIVTAGQE